MPAPKISNGRRDARNFRRKVRSRYAFKILYTLATEVAGPILIAELYEISRRKSLADAFLGRKSSLYIYLYRLAGRGLVKLDGLRRQRSVVLTREGERELERYMEHCDSNERIDLDLPRCEGLGMHRQNVPLVLQRKMEAYVERRRQAHALSKKETLFYISYDLPKEFEYERGLLKSALGALGFKMMHESFYVGAHGVEQIIEAAERIGLLPFIAWGKITPLAA